MKALVLFSGGLDSTTCLALAINKFGKENVIALSVFYNQKHVKELECAKKIIKYYGCEHRKLNLKTLFEESNCSLLASSSQSIPQGEYKEQLLSDDGKPCSTYVPFRNGLFLSCAASIALSRNCSEIYYGAHKDDAAGNAYPDTSIEFNRAINEAIYLGSNKEVKIEAPFINMNKAEVVNLGTKLKVPYQLTWSCYEGGEKPCGKCATCLDRIKAFKENGLIDPLEYEEIK